MIKYLLITFMLTYQGEVVETNRLEFPSYNQCHNVVIQLEKGVRDKSYAFECREISK